MTDVISSTMKKMILYFDGDVRRINHAIKVHNLSRTIAQLEGVLDKKLEILEIAAILHDIGIKQSEIKYNSSAGKYQQIEGPPIVRELLNEFDLNEGFVERVCYLVGNHHTYSKIDDIDFQILVEADFLVNIFEEGMEIEHVQSIMGKYFKTSTGLLFLKNMYQLH